MSSGNWRLGRFIVLVVALALVLAACGGGSSSEGSDTTAPAGTDSPATSTEAGGDMTQLRIAATGVDSLPFMAILQVAADRGYFAEEGLDVSFLSGQGGGNTLRLISTGDADIAITGGTAVVLAAMQDEGTKIIGSWFQVNDFFWIGPEEVDSLDGVVLGATSAGSATELVCSYLKEVSGADITCELLGGGMGDSWAAAKSGAITAGWAMHPFVTDKVTNEDAKIVVTARDIMGDFPADLVAVSTAYAEENPEALQAFFRAADRIQQDLIADTGAVAEELSPILGIEPDLLAAGLEDTPDLEVAYSLKVDPEALETLSNMMISAGQIEEPVDWATMLDQSYLPEEARADF